MDLYQWNQDIQDLNTKIHKHQFTITEVEILLSIDTHTSCYRLPISVTYYKKLNFYLFVKIPKCQNRYEKPFIHVSEMTKNVAFNCWFNKIVVLPDDHLLFTTQTYQQSIHEWWNGELGAPVGFIGS